LFLFAVSSLNLFFSALSCFLISFSSSSLYFLFSFTSSIAKLSSLVSSLARGNDLSGIDDGSGRTKNSDMLECKVLVVLLGVSADEDICTAGCTALPDSNAGALVVLELVDVSGSVQTFADLGLFQRLW